MAGLITTTRLRCLYQHIPFSRPATWLTRPAYLLTALDDRTFTMGYDVLGSIIEITDTSKPLKVKLQKISRLLVRTLAFDHCSIYLWEPKKKRFALAASYGKSSVMIKTYPARNTLAGLVKEQSKCLESTIRNPDNPVCHAIFDPGLTGFRYSRIYPLKDDRKFYGVMYLSACVKPALPLKLKRMLMVGARQIASNIRYDQSLLKLKGTLNELKSVQEKLVNSERLLALGELSATLAHEVKNPLVSIGGLASRLAKRIGPNSELQTYIVQISKEVARLEGVIDGILNFTEDKGSSFTQEELNLMIDDVLELFDDARRSRRIKLKKDMTNKKIQVVADPSQLKIAFDNIISNAIQSMRKGGLLTVSTQKVKHWGIVTITDNGGGIEPRLIGNIFNPFFTTRKAGTGLGLPITQKIITRHKGHIDVTNDFGNGMTFVIKLPCS